MKTQNVLMTLVARLWLTFAGMCEVNDCMFTFSLFTLADYYEINNYFIVIYYFFVFFLGKSYDKDHDYTSCLS